jgi:hypothetical protein
VAFPFVEEHAASRRRLQELVARLTPADFARATRSGWTISALLAHLAFWDNRVLVLLRRWKAQGVDESPIDPDAMNDALRPLFLAMDPEVAAQLCLSSARAVDADLETVTSSLAQEIEASSTYFRFNRALHRDDHLNEIENLLGAQRSGEGS